MLEAIARLKDSKAEIIDVLTPFPVHGLDDALSIKRSRIPIVGFICGSIGALAGFGFQAWVFTSGYPLVIGGKPLLAIPSFIPVTFECTVLFAGLGMVAAMLIRSKLKPDRSFEPVNNNITDDTFVILVDSENGNKTPKSISASLSGIQTVEII